MVRHYYGALIALTSLLLFSSVAFAQQGKGDYDGDGRSDLVVYLTDRVPGTLPAAGSTAVLARKNTGAVSAFYTFPIPFDAMIHGKFFRDDRRTFPGGVYVRDVRLPLEWYVASPSGQLVFFQYGTPGMEVPNQGDADCDGITDITVASAGTGGFAGFKIWHVALSSTGTVQQRLFGLASDRIAFADVDGDGCDELLALRIENGEFHWYSSGLFENEVKVVRWGLPGDIPLLPTDLGAALDDNDAQAEYIIARRTGAVQTAFVRYNDGRFTTFTMGLSTSVPMVGDFLNDNPIFRTPAWAQRDQGLVGIRGPKGELILVSHGIATNGHIRPDGTVVPPNADPAFYGSNTPPPPPPGSCSQPTFPDGRGGALWKPEREGGFIRTGDSTFLIGKNNGSLSDRVELIGTGGKVFNMVLRYHGGNGGRTVWDAREDNHELAPFAPLTVRTHFKNGACEDRVVPNPDSRYD